MRIALFDRNEYDDVDQYARYGRVSVHTRFNAAAAADADVVVVTHSRPPDRAGAVIVNMAAGDRRHLSHVRHARVIHAREWNRHDVASFAIGRILERRPGRVGIVGAGRIGGLVGRFLAARGVVVIYAHLGAVSMPPVDVLSLHFRGTDEGRRTAERLVLGQRAAFLVNTSRRTLVRDEILRRGLVSGRVVGAALDGGREFPDPRVAVTGHVAWRGPRSRRLRPLRVMACLRAISDGE